MHCTNKVEHARAHSQAHAHTHSVPACMHYVLQDSTFTQAHTLPPSGFSPCRELEYQVSCLCAEFVLTAFALLLLYQPTAEPALHRDAAAAARSGNINHPTSKLCQWFKRFPGDSYICCAGCIWAAENPKCVLNRFYQPLKVFWALGASCNGFFLLKKKKSVLFLCILTVPWNPRWPCCGASRGRALWGRRSGRKGKESKEGTKWSVQRYLSKSTKTGEKDDGGIKQELTPEGKMRVYLFLFPPAFLQN